jgi:hypothetical protein
MSIEKSNDLIGNRTRYRPVCSMVPQPTTLPRAPSFIIVLPVYQTTCRHVSEDFIFDILLFI